MPGEGATGTETTPSEALVYLAQTSADPLVIAAVLRELPTVYASRSSRKRAPDADYERAIVKHLNATDPAVFSAALQAARVPLMVATPSESLTSAIADLAAPERTTSRRAGALTALGLLRANQRGPRVLAVFEQALSAQEPFLITLALLCLSQSAPSLDALPRETQERIASKVLELARHPDPGVRGRSLLVLAEVEGLVGSEARRSLGTDGLGDPHPYPRGQAADLLSKCHEPMAIHALIAHVGDLAEARYELAEVPALDSDWSSRNHAVPGRPRVADAMLFAIRELSQGIAGLNPLRLSLGADSRSSSLLLRNGQLARRWYRAEATQIPRTPIRGRYP